MSLPAGAANPVFAAPMREFRNVTKSKEKCQSDFRSRKRRLVWLNPAFAGRAPPVEGGPEEGAGIPGAQPPRAGLD